jgi:hypothetical protein
MIQFPNNRLTYTGKQGPVYDNDGQNAINNLYSAVNMLLGLSPTGFAILSGFIYSSGSYGSGYFYLNGVIYYFAGSITSGQCLVPNVTQINNAEFSDGVLRNTYQIFGSTTSSTASGSSSPLFTSNMDSYRLNLTVLNNLILSIINNIGSGAGNIPIVGAAGLNDNAAVVTDSTGKLITNAIGVSPGMIPKVGGAGGLGDNLPVVTDGVGCLTTNSNSQASPATIPNNFNTQALAGGVIDLSTAVPPNKLAIIHIQFTSTSGLTGGMILSKNGESNANNKIYLNAAATGAQWYGQVLCFVDNASKINVSVVTGISEIDHFHVQGYI